MLYFVEQYTVHFAGGGWLCKGENYKALKVLRNENGAFNMNRLGSECQWELRAKIKHCESCGLKNEQDEAEEKQELLVPPWRMEGAVKY